jgi:hypothetical protein
MGGERVVLPAAAVGSRAPCPGVRAGGRRSRGAAFGTCAKGRKAGKIWAPWWRKLPALAAAAVSSEEEGREYGWWRLGKNGGWECKIANLQGREVLFIEGH